ncbi:protein of unknown function (plasmid) [Paraburkholderia dioscoreae]|uniref:Uncharacterized protein n=1 Tax=Paraburkholderia dioscoreae TaxID=2604047 RepID=A0A5Q4YWN2_9BURK|nr:protein of unknown function [Paraburkholderia dioscoreae]
MAAAQIHVEAIHPALWTYTLTMHSLWVERTEALCGMAST